MMSNIQRKKFALNVRRDGLQPSIFVRSFGAITTMVALGFVERQAERYQNGPVAATFLSGRTPADLRPLLRFWNRLSYPA